jgi:hypothetical protein
MTMLPLVRVRCETAMLGLVWGETAELTRTPLVDSAIAQGRLSVLETEERSDVSAVPAGGAEATAGAAAPVESGRRPAAKVSRRRSGG